MRKNKYNAKKTFCKQGHKHDSRTEAARCDELHEQQDAGLISNLQVHKKYTLLGAQKYPGGTKNERSITYTPDFVYEKIGGCSHCQHLHRVSVLPAAPLGTHRRGGADAEHAGRRAGLYPADAGDVLSPAPLFRGRGL